MLIVENTKCARFKDILVKNLTIVVEEDVTLWQVTLKSFDPSFGIQIVQPCMSINI
jgi:hypothetical protein